MTATSWPKPVQFDRQRLRDVGQAAGLGEGRRFTCGQHNSHGLNSSSLAARTNGKIGTAIGYLALILQ